MEENATPPPVHEPPKPTDRMAKARAALAQKRAKDKLITLQREAEKIDQKIKDADEYSKTHPPVPEPQPMQVEEVVQTPIIHEEKIVENEKPVVQEEAIVAEPVQEPKPMSSSEDILVTPLAEENRIEAPKEKKRKRDSEKSKKKKHEGSNSRTSKSKKHKGDSKSSESEESSDDEPPRVFTRPSKRPKLDPIPVEQVSQPSIFSRISQRAHQVANGIRSIPVPDHVTNFARDTATNCGWACVVFAGVLLQRYAIKVGASYIFPNGRYPGHENYRPIQPSPQPTPQQSIIHPPPMSAPSWQQQQTTVQPRYNTTTASSPGWSGYPIQNSMRSNAGSIQGAAGQSSFLSR